MATYRQGDAKPSTVMGFSMPFQTDMHVPEFKASFRAFELYRLKRFVLSYQELQSSRELVQSVGQRPRAFFDVSSNLTIFRAEIHVASPFGQEKPAGLGGLDGSRYLAFIRCFHGDEYKAEAVYLPTG